MKPLFADLLAGGTAGIAVDVSLFPVDTMKTRLQSGVKDVNVRNVYKGLSAVLLGSAPGAALFFASYELCKGILFERTALHPTLNHLVAASIGEINACIIRVPVEVVKQRAQMFTSKSTLTICRSTLESEGLIGLYRGFVSTVCREVPFSMIQFPLWEFLKSQWRAHDIRKSSSHHYNSPPVDLTPHPPNSKSSLSASSLTSSTSSTLSTTFVSSTSSSKDLSAWKSAVCGSIAGAVSAALTNPLDVAKTRIMLAEKSHCLAKGNIFGAMNFVFQRQGFPGLFAGTVPRVIWISLGGFVFLGSFDFVRNSITTTTQTDFFT